MQKTPTDLIENHRTHAYKTAERAMRLRYEILRENAGLRRGLEEVREKMIRHSKDLRKQIQKLPLSADPEKRRELEDAYILACKHRAKADQALGVLEVLRSETTPLRGA